MYSAISAIYTLKRNSIISPSCTTYSLPSERNFPASLTALTDPNSSRSENAIVSARINPLSKSECITPAAWGAFDHAVNVHARVSLPPAVKNVRKSNK